MVSCKITTGTEKVCRIKYLFYPHDAEEILKICIQASRDGDFVVCTMRRMVYFLLKVCTVFALNLKDSQDHVGQSSDEPEEERGIWEII